MDLSEILRRLAGLSFDDKVALGLALLVAAGLLWGARSKRTKAAPRPRRHLDELGGSPVGSIRRPAPNQVTPRAPSRNRLAA